MTDSLEIRNLRVAVDSREILKGVNLVVPKGEIHALMGPNGSGKSTLAQTLLGHPRYEVLEGEVIWKGQNILELSPDERARLGLFLAFQYPVEIPGVVLGNFLHIAYQAVKGVEIPIGQFNRMLMQKLRLLDMDSSFVSRNLNDGFSGGEKKRCEILQLAILEPEFAILDETDSGLDIDAVRIVASAFNKVYEQGNGNMGALIITHYSRILRYIQPLHKVHVMMDGRIVLSSGPEIVEELEEKGYEWLEEKLKGEETIVKTATNQ
ncbi:MAG: Fe-S cluster assembly ATPase SufC [Armatimonadota bacterium]|nr:Fe-S cluster assembly ATPase SufC [Armatimonadota bacterium]MDW8143715.1 Fe-S cluster assembly ATPase SufC [Armatimonadota bacterium]